MARPKQGDKVQFSINMDKGIKAQLGRLASVRGVSISRYIEELAKEHVDSIDPSTWSKISALQNEIGAVSPSEPREAKHPFRGRPRQPQ